MGKTALVTGAGRRLGAYLAFSLAKDGWDIFLHYHTSQPQVLEVKKSITSLGRKCEVFQADLSLVNGAKILWDQVQSRGVPVDLLVTGASSYGNLGWEEMDYGDWETSGRLEAWAPFALSRFLIEQGHQGAQGVFILDTRFKDYDKKHIAYHLGKRRLFDLFRILAWEGAPQLRFNAIAPGLILKSDNMAQEKWDSLRTSNPLQALGSPEDAAKALRFLISSPFITGQVIYVDGGRHLKGDLYGP